MSLNITHEVIADILIGSIMLTSSIYCALIAYKKKIKPLYFFSLGWLTVSIFIFLEGIAFMLLNIELYRLAIVLVFPASFFIVLGVDYTIKESISIVKMGLVFSIGSLSSYLAFDSNAFTLSTELGYATISWLGLSALLGSLQLISLILIYFHWTFKTWRNSPAELKTEMRYFVIGAALIGPVDIVIYLMAFESPVLLLANIVLAVGSMINLGVMIKEPKILYILPFTPYRLIVIDNQGLPLYEYQWTESDIDYDLISGLLTAIQNFSDEVINKGKILEIKLEEAVLILEQSEKYITLGLIASKSSKFLKESIKKFLVEFQSRYREFIEDETRELNQFETADELIEKYFSHLPLRNK